LLTIIMTIIIRKGKLLMLRPASIAVLLLLLFSAVLLSAGCLENVLSRLEEEEGGDQILPQEPDEQEIQAEDSEEKKRVIPEGMLPLQLYFLEEKTDSLVPVTVFTPWTEGVARASLEKLVSGLTPGQEMRYGLRALLPPDTKILGLTIREGKAVVDFNHAFLEYNPEEERRVLNSVIFTLLQFPAVEKVEFWVDGEALESFPGGTPGGNPLGRERGINLEVDQDVEDFQDITRVTLYFCLVMEEKDIFYVPVSRVVDGDREPVQAAVEELLQGPRRETFLFSDLPQGTAVRGVELEDSTVAVNLSRELLNYQGGRSGEENIKNQLVYTLTEIPGIEQVQVLVEGEPVILPYNISFLEPIGRPLVINPLM